MMTIVAGLVRAASAGVTSAKANASKQVTDANLVRKVFMVGDMWVGEGARERGSRDMNQSLKIKFKSSTNHTNLDKL